MSDLKYQDIVEAISQIKRNQLDEAKIEGAAAGGFSHRALTSRRKIDPRVKLTPTGPNKGPTIVATLAAIFGGLGAAGIDERGKRAREAQADARRLSSGRGTGIQEEEEAPLIDPEIARQAKTPGYVKVPGGFDAPVGPSIDTGIRMYGNPEPLSINPDYIDRVNRANSYRNEKLGLSGRPNISTKVKRFVEPGGPLAPSRKKG